MATTFRTKLLASHLVLVVAVVGVTILALNWSLGGDLSSKLDQRLVEQARGAAAWMGSGRHPEKLATRLGAVVHGRVTVVEESGKVIADSDFPGDAAPAVPNLGGAPEVAIARKGGVGRAIRRSETTGEDTQFVAVRTDDGTVLRLGVPLADIRETLVAMRRRLLLAAGLACLAALGLALLAARLVVRPLRDMNASAQRIARGDYRISLATTAPDEFGALSRSLAELATQLEARIARLSRLETMRRDFVANVSHELRTPVTAIQGYAETLTSGAPLDAATQKEFLEVIHRHSQRIGRLVEDLLRLSEIEARAPEARVREAVPLAAVCAHVERTMKDRAAAAGATLVIDVPADLAARGDRVEVEQVIDNLVGNALKYGKPSGGRVSIRASSSGSGARVQLVVSDDGPGIAAEHLPRIFERFYRVDPSRSRERGGTGLGLAIVKHLVEAMDGTVTLASTVGQGCHFTIDLPSQ